MIRQAALALRQKGAFTWQYQKSAVAKLHQRNNMSSTCCSMLCFDQYSSCMDALPDLLDDARALLADADQKLARLRAIDPYLIDISLRENPVGSGIGHTLEDKLRILPQLRAFGMRNIHLGSLDYPMPEEHEVDDDFMAWLRDHEVDMNGCFAFTDTGAFDAAGSFQPSPSML